MKLIPIFSLFGLILSMIVVGCDNFQSDNSNSTIENKTANKFFEPPQQKRIYLDSLIISIPGENGVKAPIKVSNNLPDRVDFNGKTEIIPGLSFFPLTIEEKAAGKRAIKTKKPEVIKVDFLTLENHQVEDVKEPTVSVVLPVMEIVRDSVDYVNTIAVQRGLFSLNGNDTIFPPVSIVATQPTTTIALPFRYKDDPTYNISFLDSDQELPNSYIRSIKKDKNGIIWLGTHTGGLISYNGKSFDQYLEKNGLTDDQVISLLIDSKDDIWIGTQEGGLNRFDGNRIVSYKTDQGLPSNYIISLLEDSKGLIWIATGRGLTSFNGKTFTTYKKSNGLPMNQVISLIEDKEGNIWIGTNGKGVSKWDGKTFTNFSEKDGLIGDFVLSISEDNNGNIWFGTKGKGLSKFDGVTFTNYTIKQGLGGNNILSIIQDKNSNLWFGTWGNGVTRFNGKSFSHYRLEEGLNDTYIRFLYEDEIGNIWIGTDGGGISKLSTNGFVNFTEKHGLKSNLVLSILQDNNNKLWLSSFDEGLLLFDKLDELSEGSNYIQITKDQGLIKNIITTTFQDSNNDFWFGGYGGGLSKLDGKSLSKGKLEFTNYSVEQGLQSDIVRSIIQDNFGNMWIGTDLGVSKLFDNKLISFTNENEFGGSKILCVYQDKNDAIWFGTMDGGVSRYKNDTLTTYTVAQGLAHNSVWTIKEDNNGILWFGTDGGGLSYFDGDFFKTINYYDGLCNNYVFSIHIDNNNSLWAGTVRGLSHIKLPEFNLSEVKITEYDNMPIINYNVYDGLKSTDFYTHSVHQDKMSRIWWGTYKALTMLDLENYHSMASIPIIHLDGIEINNTDIDFNELSESEIRLKKLGIIFSSVEPYSNMPTKLSLPFDQNHITFKFCATDWSAPSQIKYQFKLEGFDNDWSSITKERLVDYRNISPGNYTFKLKSIGKNNIWSNEVKYNFTIRNPWWMQWWSYIIYGLAVILFFWIILRWRVNIVQRQKLVLEGMVGKRTNELERALITAEQATNAKSQFIATISHEIRTPLHAIMGFTHLAKADVIDAKQGDYLQKIDRSANTMLSLINDILDFSKIEAGKLQLEKVAFDIEIVLNSIIVLNATHARNKGLEFIVSISPEIPRMLIGDPLRIGQVITNLCSNAIKFTHEGEVHINIDIAEKLSDEEFILRITVHDTGIGISKEQIPLLFEEFKQTDNSITRKYGGTGLGLTISKLLVELMDGDIWLSSEPDKGSSFFFSIKVGINSNQDSKNNIIPAELEGIRVLVCDDNKTALSSFRQTLEAFTFIVDTLDSINNLSSQLENNTYDLLLIDNGMDETIANDVISHLALNPNITPLKTLLLTDCDRSQLSLNQQIIGINDCISKPIIPSLLLDKVKEIFNLESEHLDYWKENTEKLTHIKEIVSASRVLLVEDNEINQQLILELLDKVGIKLEFAQNGLKATQMYLDGNYDLVLMDLHMPVMDGFEATIEIRKNNKTIPIIAITADVMQVVKDKCKKIGINDIITKPINPDLLYDTILKWLKPKESANQHEKKHDKENSGKSKSISSPLDMKSGIRRFGGNEELYIKMLKKFIKSNISICSEINKSFDNKDYEEAHLKTHTLKGESANIGANDVSEASRNVEQTILKRDIDSFKNQIAFLENKLLEFNKSYNILDLDSNSSRKVNPSIKELLSNIIICINNKDPKAFDLLDEIEDIGMSKKDVVLISTGIRDGKVDAVVTILDNLSKD